MIRSYNAAPDPNFYKYLDRLEARGALETTSTGFDYTVADPEMMGGDNLVVGRSTVRPDETELQLVLSEDMSPEARKLLVDICVESIGSDDRYTVARAASDVLFRADEDVAERALGHLRQNLAHHRRGFAFGNHEQHPLTVAMFRSTLGWAALATPPNSEGLYALSRLEHRGLFIPDFDSLRRLAGTIRTRRGSQAVGIVKATEPSEKHSCAHCSGQVLKNTERITVALDRPRTELDHHHYHWSCFSDNTLPRLDTRSARIEPNPYAIALNDRRRPKA